MSTAWAPGPITVTVTADHIRRGKRTDPFACPVALALRDAIPRAIAVTSGTYHCRFTVPREGVFDAGYPDRVFRFIEGFDHHARVEPLTFEITPVLIPGSGRGVRRAKATPRRGEGRRGGPARE